MKKAVIFSAGYMGKGAYSKLKSHYEIVAYSDNNPDLQGTFLNGIEIIPPENLIELYHSGIEIIVCSDYYFEITKQLLEMGILNFLVMINGFLFHYDIDEVMIPFELSTNVAYTKSTPDEKNILFVQNAACIRTNKFASLLRSAGYKVFLLYTTAAPDITNPEFSGIYEQIFTVFTMAQFIDFINNSQFDVIHSSNTPDYLTNLLLLTNKKIIHDTHDMSSLFLELSPDILAAEYIANKKSEGLLYTTEAIKKIAKLKYSISDNNCCVIENFITHELQVTNKSEKLSDADGCIHCVYEGGIGSDKTYFRYFEDIWKKFTDAKIHIHFYSALNEVYCSCLASKSPYLHYEGNFSSQKLANEMTKYDFGLVIFNVLKKNILHLETTSINKIYEYLNSGLPIAIGNIQSHIDFVNKYYVGKYIDFEKNIESQCAELKKIRIEPNFLTENSLTMESNLDKILCFYDNFIHDNNPLEKTL